MTTAAITIDDVVLAGACRTGVIAAYDRRGLTSTLLDVDNLILLTDNKTELQWIEFAACRCGGDGYGVDGYGDGGLGCCGCGDGSYSGNYVDDGGYGCDGNGYGDGSYGNGGYGDGYGDGDGSYGYLEN